MQDWHHISDKIRALLDNQQGLTTVFSFNGSTYIGTKTTLRREDYATDAGLVEGDYRFSLLCAAEQFNGDFPKQRTDKVTIDGDDYRVLSVDADAIGATIKINLGGVLA